MTDLASRSVFASFSVSRTRTALGTDVSFLWPPGLTVTTNRLSFLVIPQKSGAICLFSFLLPAMLTIIYHSFLFLEIFSLLFQFFQLLLFLFVFAFFSFLFVFCSFFSSFCSCVCSFGCSLGLVSFGFGVSFCSSTCFGFSDFGFCPSNLLSLHLSSKFNAVIITFDV